VDTAVVDIDSQQTVDIMQRETGIGRVVFDQGVDAV